MIALRGDGLELEYDLPQQTPEQQRTAQWQFPVRVFRPTQGPLQLLNGPELESRVEVWLKYAALPRAVCGHWFFTWTAIHIECDPQSVLPMLELFDLRLSNPHDGAQYIDPQLAGPMTLKSTPAAPGSAILIGETPLDPEPVRRQEAQLDLVSGEISHKPVTLDDALRARSGEKISGTIAMTFDLDAAGVVMRKTRLTTAETILANGVVQDRTTRETVQRRVVSGGSCELAK